MLLAVAQTVPVPLDVEGNVTRHVEEVRVAAASGARVVLFPELSLTGYELGGIATLALAPGDVRLEPLREVCRSTGVTAVVGAPTRRDGATYLSAVAVQPGGELIYDKRSLFGDEPTVFAPGSAAVRLTVDGFEFVLGICADLGDEAQAAEAAGSDGWLLGVLLSAGGYPADTARAAEVSRRHGMPVVLANHAGPTGGWVGHGGSGVWGPDGSVRVVSGAVGVLELGR